MMENLQDLRQIWMKKWPEALALWSKFTRLRPPLWCHTQDDAEKEGLAGSFAMIRLQDHAIVISLPLIRKFHIEHFSLEILAHEIGHHVFCPADLTDNARVIARMRWALPTKEYLAGFISNIYSDLLINDHLQRSAGLKMADIYRILAGDSADRMWTFYMRICEILWSIEKEKLAKGGIKAQMEGDAQLGARLIRSYAREWMEGAGRFAALCLPYLLDDNAHGIQKILHAWRDTEQAGSGAVPDGLTEIEEGEREGAVHPSQDPDLAELDDPEEQGDVVEKSMPRQKKSPGGARGQHREPFQYGEILRSLGLNLNDHEIAVRYYKERAAPLLVPFPSRTVFESTEPLPEGLEPWDIGSPLESVDWMESVLLSPRVIPGMTTVQRVWGTMDGTQPEKLPLDLDLYVDCSGSMPNPQVTISYLALAGAIIALSALRAGARVQATLWSGAHQFDTTGGFIRDAHKVLEILTGYLGDGTAFPIHMLRDTYSNRKQHDRPAHILIISDSGVITMFDRDELNNSGWDIARIALSKARGGGTMVLNLPTTWGGNKELARAHKEGWQISVVRTWEELEEFARQFSQLKYSEQEPA